jgi:hypothetical protein
LLVTVAPKKRELLASLTPAIGASGPHVFAVRYRRARQSQLKRPSLPDPRFVTNAHAPLRWDGMAQEVKLICLRDQARSSATHWHDGQLKKCCQVLFDGPMHVPSPLVREGDRRRSGQTLPEDAVVRQQSSIGTAQFDMDTKSSPSEGLVADFLPEEGQVLAWSAGEPARQRTSWN